MGNGRLIAAVLASGLLSSWVTVLLMGSPASPPPSASSPALDFTELEGRLEELVRALQTRPVPVSVPDEGGRRPLEESEALTAIARSLQELKAMVGTGGAGAGVVDLFDIRTPRVEVQRQAVGELRQLLNADRMAARQEHLLLTPRAVLQRYGRPVAISVSSNGSLNWSYTADPGSNSVDVTFKFMDGYVVSVQ